MSSLDPAPSATGQDRPDRGRTPREGDDETPQVTHREAQKAMVRARMFGTAAATIGRYAILEVVGEGGMGTVYACFDDRLDRKIALKLVKGAATADARSRMLVEARAMAKLSHPNVVSIFEVGEHLGRLYLAMEYVRGSTLQQWQVEPRQTWEGILGAYTQAGRGLAAAHAQGLVHRDFKPQNVVVGHDGRVRVLDFGLATRLESGPPPSDPTRPAVEPAEGEGLTETGRILGTPAYMAPEQAKGHAVDHRSDQYAFCVSLWEGLHGERPTRTGVSAPGTRGLVPEAIDSVVRRGLDASPSDRWASMEHLLEALHRAANPEETTKTPRRRVVALAAGGILLAGAAALGNRQLDEHRSRTCEHEAQELTAAMWNDDLRASIRGALGQTGFSFAEATSERAIEGLDAYARTWREAKTQGCIATRVDRTVSAAQVERAQWCLETRALALTATVQNLTEPDRTAATKAVGAVVALPHLSLCSDADALGRLPAPPSREARPEIERVRAQLAQAGTLATLGQYDAGLAAAQEAVALAESLQDPALHASSLLTLGGAQQAAGMLADAESSLTEAYFKAIDAADPLTAGQAGTQLVTVVGVALARPDEGMVWARHTQAAWNDLQLADTDLIVGESLVALAGVYSGRKGFEEAKALYERVRDTREEQLGPDHPLVARTLHNLAALSLKSGDFEEATELQLRGMKINEDAFGPDHPILATDLNVLAVAAVSVGDFVEARTLWVRALEIRKAVLGPKHRDLANAMENLGALHGMLKEWDEAIRLTERALEIFEAAVGPSHRDLAPNLMNLAEFYAESGRSEDARAALERAVAILDASPGALPLDHAEALGKLGLALVEHGDLGRARTQHERAIALLEATVGPNHPVRARELGRLGAVLAKDGEPQLAAANARRALEIFAAHDGDQEGELETLFLDCVLEVRLGGDGDAAVVRARGLVERLASKQDGASKSLRPRVEAWLSTPEKG